MPPQISHSAQGDTSSQYQNTSEQAGRDQRQQQQQQQQQQQRPPNQNTPYQPLGSQPINIQPHIPSLLNPHHLQHHYGHDSLEGAYATYAESFSSRKALSDYPTPTYSDRLPGLACLTMLPRRCRDLASSRTLASELT